MVDKLASRKNPQIKRLFSLISSRKHRESENLFVVEGAKLCFDLLATNIRIQQVFATDTAIKKFPIELEQLFLRANQSWEITEELAHWVSDTKSPQGLFAVCEMSTTKLSDIVTNGKYLLLDNLQDPGNVGTIIRSALAFNIDKVFISSDSADIYSPKVIRGSMGAIFKLQIEIVDNISNSIEELKASGVKVYAAALDKAAKTVDKSLFVDSSAVVFGNEGNGLQEEVLSVCDGVIIIPMNAGSESLNVGVAAGIIMWEMSK